LAVWMITHIKEYLGLSTDDKPAGEQPGDIFYETDTGDEYIYDGSAWVLKQGCKKFDKKCAINITGNIVASTPFTTNASGANFTKSGDDIYLGADATQFNNGKRIYIFVNGVWQENGVDITFVTSYSFSINLDFNNGDVIHILK